QGRPAGDGLGDARPAEGAAGRLRCVSDRDGRRAGHPAGDGRVCRRQVAWVVVESEEGRGDAEVRGQREPRRPQGGLVGGPAVVQRPRVPTLRHHPPFHEDAVAIKVGDFYDYFIMQNKVQGFTAVDFPPYWNIWLGS